DMTFSVDKSVSSLWAIAEPDMRARIEAMATAAARAALEDSVLRHCSYTRVTAKGVARPAEADLLGATFVHGTSRENDPQLHVHCTIFNLARTREDGKWRAHLQYPVYSWKKAAGALFRAYMAWELQEGLGARMEQYGPNAEFTRIEGMPEDLQSFWSKRRKAIVARAGELGISALGNASRMAGVNKLTRAGKSHDNDPEVRHRRWRDEATGYVEREELIASVTGHDVKIGREAIRALTDRLDDLPAHLAREEAIFRRPDMVEAAANAAAGLMGRDAVGTVIERLRRNPEIERLEPKKPTAESRAGMAHTEVYSTRHNLGLEQAVKDMAGNMAADTGHGLPEETVKKKIETLLAGGYPLSQEQSLAIRHATVKGGRVAVIEGAAGSGKTTTLRPITDLHREHGYEIVPTAVAWRTAVALGDDCDARAYCVDKLLKLAAKGQVEIGKRTLIVVDEAGMLSTRQAHHILQLSERHGAKVVFAGDTRQQQPVEAGPGLRLIRDVARSVRVDRIRRQKADLEDVLVHVHGETPEQARFRAGLTNAEERDAILADYEAMETKPLFTPWQGAVSEALRDGEAEEAIEAWHLRNRLHLCHDEEKTLTRLVDDWERHARAQPGTSTVVLARTKAEGRALSWLMRERVLARTPDVKRTVIEVSRDLDGRLTEPLEIAVGDRIRIGATRWEKQLFNGTVVTVEDLEVRPAQAAAVSRKARNRRAAGRGSSADTDRSEPEFSVHITARTDDGRRVAFRHDEIRDWHDNIRLDYGYAMTVASAQGLTVDRAFLLVDDRPARETIYPAATRHREGLDIYVNRSSLVFDITEHRPEDRADMPVTDSDVRAYLAERWSRSQPKEAALDYVSDGAWRDAREEMPRRGPGARKAHRDAAEAPEAANDNALIRIAHEIRHAVNGWRHGAAVDAFAAERGEVLAAWDELRARAREEGDAVALSPVFRETL
ncbi:MAG: relaxase domain-containing protein, partial [Defluviicoccus sp.]|nr:relaxase domain-containing protein [Defluviicoccus sp.]